MTEVTIPLRWEGLEPAVKYQVYRGMRLWLVERDIKHSFEFDTTGSYYPSSVSMDEISAISFRLIF